jgi:putative transposase
MPWKEQKVMDQRKEFIRCYLKGEKPFNQLCQEYGISTKTGYKWKRRYRDQGMCGLEEMSRRPSHHASQLGENVIIDIIRIKLIHMDFGPRKIHNLYNRSHGAVISESSVKRVLRKARLYKPRKIRHVNPVEHESLILEADAPNDVWTIDFKGYWMGYKSSKCEPLTVVDQYSRFILHCLPLEKSDTEHVKAILIELFIKYGLPRVIKSDNGSPFANNLSVRGLTRLTAWLMSLGIKVHHIKPGTPGHNGKHERMHRDLKRRVQRGNRYTVSEYVEMLKAFQTEYNEERPHEALGMLFPCEIYKPSDEKYHPVSKDIEYPLSFDSRLVNSLGQISFESRRYKISTALYQYRLGLIEKKDHEYDVYFCDIFLGKINTKTQEFIKVEKALQVETKIVNPEDFCGNLNLKVLPMF